MIMFKVTRNEEHIFFTFSINLQIQIDVLMLPLISTCLIQLMFSPTEHSANKYFNFIEN